MARPKDHGRYTSVLNAAARTAARMLVLKPVVWRAVNVKVHEVDRLESVEGGFIVVANHSSHLDTPLIFGALPARLSRYLSTGAAADYFFDKWWRAFGPVLLFNSFPVERRGMSKGEGGRGQAGASQPKLARSRRAAAKGEDEPPEPKEAKGGGSRRGLAGSLLSDGIPLLIFPEGTRSRDGAMGPFKPGSAALAISRGVPTIPIALVGAYAAWPADQRRIVRGRPEVHVVIGRPMRPNPGEIAYQFSERVRREIIELHDSTARAYGMRTLSEYARAAAIERAKREDAASG